MKWTKVHVVEVIDFWFLEEYVYYTWAPKLRAGRLSAKSIFREETYQRIKVKENGDLTQLSL